jgi:FtsP/CotA-like multicopper oxidase with cupredoxin domain
MNYQQQAEEEMWDAASRHYEERSYRYRVQVPGTGAICMNTDSLEEAQVRAGLVGGTIIDTSRPAPDYDSHIDHPERYSDGKPI